MLAKGLLSFRRINTLQPDFDLFILTRLTAASGEGVAVRDADDKAEKGGREHAQKPSHKAQIKKPRCLIASGLFFGSGQTLDLIPRLAPSFNAEAAWKLAFLVPER